MSSQRILILGLDGATWQVLTPMIDAGELPNLKRLSERGSRGVLRSISPPITAPAWTSFQTGTNPGKHGVFDFRIFDRAEHRLWLASSNDIKLPTLWQVASAAGKKVVVINLPMTYPPKPVNGIMIGGMLAQKEDSSLIYPAQRYDEIFSRHPGYRISPPVISQRKAMGRRAFIEANIDVERLRCELALDLLKREEWDIFMLQNQCLDYIQHAYFHLLDPAAPEFNPSGYQDVLRYFQAMDDNVGRLCHAAPSGTDIIILSDHGFKLQHRLVHLAPWLRKQGYLVERVSNRQRLLQAARKADIFRLRRRLAHRLLPDKQARFAAPASTALGRIDWQRSRAYVGIGSVFGCIYVNRDNPDVPSDLLQELASQLEGLKDPISGRRVVSRVYHGQDIYHGPYAQSGPDLLLEPQDDFSFAAPALISRDDPFASIDFELEIPGGHHPDGVLIWAGDGVHTREGTSASLIDLAPTILARLGIPIPKHMDGTPLTGIFEQAPPLSFFDWGSDVVDSPSNDLSEDDEAALKKRLRDLGYL